MSARNISVHGVKRVEIHEVEGTDDSVWRHIEIVCEDRHPLKILSFSSFPPQEDRRIETDAIPVVFVRCSTGDRS
jgi:hypothetical protein